MASEKPAPARRPWWADDLALALMFLTRLPVPAPLRAERPLMHAGWAFPLVGLLTGALGGGALLLGATVGLPLLAAALLALALGAILTGALHEDGLADLADGFGGGGTKERKIEIMRDSRVGSYGVLALVIVTGLKAAALANIAIAAPWLAAFAFAAAQVLGRTAILPVAYFLAPATASGLGTGAGRPKAVTTGLCIALGTLICFSLLPGAGFVTALIATSLAALATAGLAQRQIGGYTGDVLGGSEQVVECFVLLSLSLLPAGAAGFSWPL
ncbi:adenosylcobinamide-GDP ribazoletransferase [Nisaea acidiphila]|uniref:Adenosylcobinamide-GDP ribazoletransferase n=1 Tax=Nisaea acidiphila TaxID=1862145 RepID=A0A9J7AXF5_9PROT|nr:adenosylcobinamide-GDP ribazoletransferase [Nisaea acidiphila]UUX52063.1 adenosylcobinamide-GDP ribazoletransferase [Nisaea acidiphila]